MGKVCLKCDYERQSDDVAPEWQCPSCEAVYSKVEQAAKQRVDVKNQRLTPKQELSERFSRMVVVTTPSKVRGQVSHFPFFEFTGAWLGNGRPDPVVLFWHCWV